MGVIKLCFHAGHLGGGSGDALSTFLAALALKHAKPDEWASKYGTNFENDQFLMHPYCWCEKDECLWCGGMCGCPEEACETYLDGVLIKDWYEANCRIVAPLPSKVAEHGTPEYEQAEKIFDASIEERDRRLVRVHMKRFHSCPPKGLMTNREAGLDWRPDQRAPNFWHKPSGFKVWWYKYIGRDMEIHGTPPEEMAGLVSEADITRLYESVERAHKSFEALLAAVNVNVELNVSWS